MFGTIGFSLWQQGIKSVVGTEIGIILMALFLYFCGKKLNDNKATYRESNTDSSIEQLGYITNP